MSSASPARLGFALLVLLAGSPCATPRLAAAGQEAGDADAASAAARPSDGPGLAGIYDSSRGRLEISEAPFGYRLVWPEAGPHGFAVEGWGVVGGIVFPGGSQPNEVQAVAWRHGSGRLDGLRATVRGCAVRDLARRSDAAEPEPAPTPSPSVAPEGIWDLTGEMPSGRTYSGTLTIEKSLPEGGAPCPESGAGYLLTYEVGDWTLRGHAVLLGDVLAGYSEGGTDWLLAALFHLTGDRLEGRWGGLPDARLGAGTESAVRRAPEAE